MLAHSVGKTSDSTHSDLKRRIENLERQALELKLMTQEQFEKECQKIANMKKISQKCADIRNIILFHQRNELVLHDLFQDLIQSINRIEVVLQSEVVADSKSNDSLQTLYKLEDTVNKSLDTTNTLEDKDKSITEFRNFARNATLSKPVKYALGGVIGGLSNIGITIAAICIFSPLLLTGPVGWGLITAGVILLVGAAIAGAKSGVEFANILSQDQDDSRGHEVSKNMHTLVRERNKLFQRKQEPKPEVEEKLSFKMG